MANLRRIGLVISWNPREKSGEDSKHPYWIHNCKIEKAHINTSRRQMFRIKCKYFIAASGWGPAACLILYPLTQNQILPVEIN